MEPEVEEDYGLISLFDVSPVGFPWPAEVVRTIEKRRAQMADFLIFDILLSLGGIKNSDALYPPRDATVLQRLLNAVEDSTYDALKKDSIIYMLLKWHRDGRETYYAQSRCIPPQFVALAEAYWCLDAGEDVSRAVSLLADARLNRDYTSKILQAISLDADSHKLILRYIRTAKPLLTEPNDIDAYTIALAESSLSGAWQYQRTYPEGTNTRARLIRNILTWCLTPKPRSKPLTQLIAFPLSPYEQSQLHDYALRPPQDLPASAIPVIQDLACVRLIQSGQYVAAIKLDRQFTINPVRGKVTEIARRVAQDRKQTMEEIMATLPFAERQLLELELDATSQSVGDVSAFLNGSVPDLTMSWENVRSPKVNGTTPVVQQQKETIPQPVFETPTIPQRSGAPRFGGPSPSPAISTGASTSFTAVREMFDAIAKQSPKQPQREQREQQPLSMNTPDTVHAATPKGTLPQTATAGPSSLSQRRGGVSLFDTVGSANRTPNAFFQPPVSAGTKRPLEDVTSPPRRSPPPPRRADISTDSAADISTMLNATVEEEEDVEMHEGDLTFPHIEDMQAQTQHLCEPEELSFSLFTPTADSGRPTSTQRPKESPRSPPGAFVTQESEEETYHEQYTAGAMRMEELETQTPSRKRGSRATRSQQQQQPTRVTRTRSAQVEAQLMRSIPGAFVDEIEEEDAVPPLPTSTSMGSNASRRTTRKTRSSRAVSEEAKTPSRPTRRSSRLSAVSAESSSPEPVSPERVPKGRKSTRSSGTAAPTTRTTRSTRKHR